ncbi:MAG: DUF192 domain-containing protein [Nanoarchaeota archaeon]
MKSLLSLILASLIMSSCSPVAQKDLNELSDGDFVRVSDRSFQVEAARTEAEHVQGLSGHPPLKDDEGMLFIFDDAQVRHFWMKDMLFPLDIVFIGEDGRIVDIKRDFQPCVPISCPSYSSAAPARYVLEVYSGRMDRIFPGQRVIPG